MSTRLVFLIPMPITTFDYFSYGCAYPVTNNDTDQDGLSAGNVTFENAQGITILTITLSCDNCGEVYNPNQQDTDCDGVGDVCDNCIEIPNQDQQDRDSDTLAMFATIVKKSAIFTSLILMRMDWEMPVTTVRKRSTPAKKTSTKMGSGMNATTALYLPTPIKMILIRTALETLVITVRNPNPGQIDNDGDGIGSEYDNCPTVFNQDQLDFDLDGFGDGCDVCPEISDPAQSDQDSDGVGDLCDNCIVTINPEQEDEDEDDIGDVCDICPNISFFDEFDSDSDGLGDVCDNCPKTSTHYKKMKMVMALVTCVIKPHHFEGQVLVVKLWNRDSNRMAYIHHFGIAFSTEND